MINKFLFITIIAYCFSLNPQLKAQNDSLFINTELLGRPTDKSITVNAMSNVDLNVYIEYGLEPSNYSNQTEMQLFQANEPIEIVISGLQCNTQYYYRMSYKVSDASQFISGDEHFFHTQRLKNSSFTFAVHADPHLDEQSNPDIYIQTLYNTLADEPDFLIDLGDNFMSDKIHVIYPEKIINYQEIVNRHLLLRNYYDLVCHSMSLFLVLGNHEAEYGWELINGSENMAAWATTARKLYYPNPAPDHFYSGNTVEDAYSGFCENYYSFEWGNALFIILDPYRYTLVKPGKQNDNWAWTLGGDQYHWFRRVLEKSDATFKFVFAHQIIGGKDTEGRGGAEYVDYYEMGGLNEDGSYGFNEKRPGWGKPIHQLMVENEVAVFFHGHDHFFAKQEKDGVIYQLVPQPSHPNYRQTGQAEEYGYIYGDILPNSGHLRVTVNLNTLTVDYVRTYLPKDEDEKKGRKNGSKDFSYSISSETKVVENNAIYQRNFKLVQNYPNPFNASTTIEYSIPERELIQLTIFDISGRVVKTLVNQFQEAGTHYLSFEMGKTNPSGIYFYQIKAGKFTRTQRLLYLK